MKTEGEKPNKNIKSSQSPDILWFSTCILVCLGPHVIGVRLNNPARGQKGEKLEESLEPENESAIYFLNYSPSEMISEYTTEGKKDNSTHSSGFLVHLHVKSATKPK